jgi:hypothetical protein
VTDFSNLAKKIVDNLEIKLSHIHVRYEDDTTFPGETFSCGCTLESFLVTTTDEKWSETFVNRDAKKDGSASVNFKLAKSSNFGVYWNIKSPGYGNLAYEEWKNIMKSCIVDIPVPTAAAVSSSKAKTTSPTAVTSSERLKLTYIIEPSNYGQLKITHNESPTVVPQLSIRFESSDLKLHFDKLQMRQSMKAMFTMQAMQEKMHLLKHRPLESAVQKPWQWWEYMLILIAKKPDLLEKKVRFEVFLIVAFLI